MTKNQINEPWLKSDYNRALYILKGQILYQSNVFEMKMYI